MKIVQDLVQQLSTFVYEILKNINPTMIQNRKLLNMAVIILNDLYYKIFRTRQLPLKIF